MIHPDNGKHKLSRNFGSQPKKTLLKFQKNQDNIILKSTRIRCSRLVARMEQIKTAHKNLVGRFKEKRKDKS
jgi:hypothetical protein